MTDGALRAPPLIRRLACMVYEGVLLFGLILLCGLLYAGLTQQRHALQGQLGLQLLVFGVVGIYFVGFWHKKGQTLPMKTWHIQLRSANGGPVSWQRAAARYALSWLWFLPALAVSAVAQVKSAGEFGAVLLAGVFAYAAASWLTASRQFVHDVLCGTRLVDVQPHGKAQLQTPDIQHKKST